MFLLVRVGQLIEYVLVLSVSKRSEESAFGSFIADYVVEYLCLSYGSSSFEWSLPDLQSAGLITSGGCIARYCYISLGI